MLQQVGAHSAIVKWRDGPDQVCFAKKISKLNKEQWPHCVTATATGGNHKEALLTGLNPDHTYYYSLGAPGSGSGNIEQSFRTAPPSNKPPKDGNTHIWLIGDSGTETEQSPFTGQFTHPGEAEEVKQGFLAYNADKEPVDLFVWAVPEVSAPDGVRLAERLRREHPAVDLVILTDPEPTVDLENTDHVLRGCPDSHLRRVVAEALVKRGLRRENIALTRRLETIEKCRTLMPCQKNLNRCSCR